MKFTCLQKNLEVALSLAAPIAAKSSALPVLQNLLLRVEQNVLTINSTNLEVGLTTVVRGKEDEAGEITAPAGLLAGFVSLLDEEQVTLSSKGTALTITSGKQTTTIQGVDATDFPIIPPAEKGTAVRVTKEALREALLSVSFSIVPNDVRPEIGGMLCVIEKNSMVLVGTDSYRLAERTIQATGGTDARAILPLKTAQEAARILSIAGEDAPEAELEISENQLRLRMGSTELVSRLVEGTYPSYRDIIPTATATSCVVGREQLLRAIKRASLFCSSGINDLAVKFSLPKENNSKGIIVLSSRNTQTGSHEETLDAAITGKENNATFNWRYLADGLQHITTDEVIIEMVDSMSPGIVRPSDAGKRGYLYLVMPIRQ